MLLSIFLVLVGIQVFFILRDFKKALDKFNDLLQTGGNIASDIEKPISAASNLVTEVETKAVAGAAKVLGNLINPKPKPKRFYKKVL